MGRHLTMPAREGHPAKFGCLRISEMPIVTRTAERVGISVVIHCRQFHRWETPDGVLLELDVDAPRMRRVPIAETSLAQRELAGIEQRMTSSYVYEAIDPSAPQAPLPGGAGSA